ERLLVHAVPDCRPLNAVMGGAYPILSKGRSALSASKMGVQCPARFQIVATLRRITMRNCPITAWILAALTMFLVFGVIGCGSKPEEPDSPNYYKGSDFKQAGARGGQPG